MIPREKARNKIVSFENLKIYQVSRHILKKVCFFLKIKLQIKKFQFYIFAL